MSNEGRIDWSVTVQAFALLGYEFKPPIGFEHLPTAEQCQLWETFLSEYMQCQLECPWKGGGPCLRVDCPRIVLRRVSLNALPLSGAVMDADRVVQCDDCGEDYSKSHDRGGYVWHDRATCPKCAARIMKILPSQKLFRLLKYAQHCPPSESFADFVRSIRKHSTIKVNPPKADQ